MNNYIEMIPKFRRSICSHRIGENDKLITNKDNTVECMLCGQVFIPIEASEMDTLKTSIDTVINAINSIKILDIESKLDESYKYIQPILEDLPELFDKVYKEYYKKHNTDSAIESLISLKQGCIRNGYINNGNVYPWFYPNDKKEE